MAPDITFGYRVFLIASMLLTGTINTVMSKTLYQAHFAYPWTMPVNILQSSFTD